MKEGEYTPALVPDIGVSVRTLHFCTAYRSSHSLYTNTFMPYVQRDDADTPAWQWVQFLEKRLASMKIDAATHAEGCEIKVDRLRQLLAECSKVYHKHPVDAMRALRKLEDRIQLSVCHDRPGESNPRVGLLHKIVALWKVDL